jgi:hypothetical protein
MKYHIQTVELTSGSAGSILFNNIPQDYDDLYVVASLRSASGTLVNGLRVEFNANTSSVYSVRNLQAIYSAGPNSNINPYNTTTGMVLSFMPSPSQTANTFSNTGLYIPNYTSSTQFKSVSVDGVSENNSTFSTAEIVALNISAGLFASNSPIISIRIATQEGNSLAQHSSASLYGIKRGSSGEVETASGGIVTTSGGYTYHTFTSSGAFVPTSTLEIDALIVGGGGAGGDYEGFACGGGGAGGYLTLSGETVTAGTSYKVLVGSGGSGWNDPFGNKGTSSEFFGTVSEGGGGGGLYYGDQGASGGGAGSSGFRVGGTGIVGQGNDGGDANSNTGGGGGGGASTEGQTTATTTGGNGGAGTQWVNGNYYAGGGGGGGRGAAGGTGGIGGGGAGAAGTADSGVDNTGGGGGGAGSASGAVAGSGGSGVVIIRYLTPA